MKKMSRAELEQLSTGELLVLAQVKCGMEGDPIHLYRRLLIDVLEEKQTPTEISEEVLHTKVK